jgi:Ni,Fe-hydrogenase maturation factor
VAEVVSIARKIDPSVDNARIKVVGIEALVLDQFGIELSDPVRLAIPDAVSLCLAEAGASDAEISRAVDLASQWMSWNPTPADLAKA